MATRAGQRQTSAARRAAKLKARVRRAEKRSAARRADKREAERAAEQRQAVRVTAKAPDRQRRPVGRPRKPTQRKARWTDYRPEFARQIYRAIRFGYIGSPTREALADYIRVHPNTIDHWRERHPAFRRAISRACFDRAELRGVIAANRRIVWDLGQVNEKAKILHKLYPKARIVSVEYDGDTIEAFQRRLHMRRRFGRGAVEVDALCAIATGHLSNRAIAAAIGEAESTLRDWRRKDPNLDQVIRDAVEAKRGRQITVAHGVVEVWPLE